MLKLYKLKDYNFPLMFLLILISAIGVILVGSADSSLQSRQLMGVILGFILMVMLSLIDYSWILHFYWVIYLISIMLLVLVRLFGKTALGAARWINIGGFQFQPTELCKILLILFFAMYFMHHEKDLNSWKTIFRALILLAFPLFLILSQPDLKNTITMSIVFALMYFGAGLSYRKIGIMLAVIVPIALVLLFLIVKTDLHIVDDYQKNRIMTFLSSEDSEEYSDSKMQQQNSIMAIGSGQLTGKGLNNTDLSANSGNFISEIQNDFIFAVAGEELGFAGSAFIILLLFLIILLCFKAGKEAKDLSGTLVCYGMGSLISIQSFINICVATGLLPNTGTPLPFVSYGLTSLVSLYIGMGIVMNISLQRKKYFNYGGKYVYTGETFKPEYTGNAFEKKSS
ncbi:MAG: rod shape-determining protein RodA [Eubacterium sp.]|nr:rod shape-determining protein RodA [Eubacterium sp.]